MMNGAHLQELPLFLGIEQDDLNLLAQHVDRRSFAKNQTLFNQGDPAHHLYILLQGSVAIRYKPPDADTLDVAEITENNIFGWSSALGRDVYTSSAICLEPCEVLLMKGVDLQLLCQQHPETGVILLERLAGVIAQRLQSTHEHVKELLRNSMQPTSP